MKCNYCDYDSLPENSHLCTNCGRILIEKEEKKPVKKRKHIIFIIIAIAVIFICGMFAMNFQSSMNGNHSTHPSNDLGISYIQFKNQFNDNDYSKKINLSIGTVEKKAGSEDTYYYAFSDKLLLIEKINSQSNHLRQITLIGQPSSIQDDNIKLIGAMGIIIDNFSSDLSVNDRKEILHDLGFNETVKDLKTIDTETIRGNIKYSFKYKDNFGFIFSVSNKNDVI